MLNPIEKFFNQYLGQPADHSTGKDHTLELCAAVLMTEIAQADTNIDEAETSVIEQAISYHFHLDETETKALIEHAQKEVNDATSLRDFTKIVNDSFNAEEKTTVIELLWKVAIADNVIDKYEEYFIRKISDLLYVPHSDYIKAKHRATL
ncbi:MAG: tellurite resistance TerB family protein [Gammaproteobacteria bacterium]|jgi:uncharacterized tellurite resistance protein B-like protein